VFCTFNRTYKLNPEIFDLWMRLLKRIDGSVLWLMHDTEQATVNLRSEAAIRGIDPARLIFASKIPSLSDHLARHRLADLFLDTLPYDAHTTSKDALLAGLPVLTCRGRTFVGRIAASQLHALGLADLVTENLQEYEAVALRLAQNLDELHALRARVAANRVTHPLFIPARLCRHFEAAYIEMWERHKRGDLPKSFTSLAFNLDGSTR
jgi:protein O-GlcNAc transferase